MILKNHIDKTGVYGYGLCMKNAVIFIFLMLIGVTALEFVPIIEHARIAVPEEIYVGKDCGCDCILQSRPWYSRFNYWFWLWVLATPVFVFSVKPNAPKWQRAVRSLIAIAFCYGVMNLALHLMWDIRNGPFIVNDDPNFPDQKTWDIPGCTNIADGASLVFALFLGWIPASLYVGIWLLIREFFKRAVFKKPTVEP